MLKKIVLVAIVIVTAITAVGCGSTSGETENVNTSSIQEIVKAVLEEQKKADAEESTTYSLTESEIENVNTAAIEEAVKNVLNERDERDKRIAMNSFWTDVVLIAVLLILLFVLLIVDWRRRWRGR